MDKGSPLDDLTEESEKRVTEDDIGKQEVKIEVEGRKQDTQSTRNKIDSEEGKLGSSLDGEVSKSEDSSKTGMRPTISPNRFETPKDEEKFEKQDELKQLKSTDNLEQKFLALEKQVQDDDTEIQNVQIEVEGKEQDVVKGINEESIMPSTEEDSIRQNEEDELIGTRSKFKPKIGKSEGALIEEGSNSEEPEPSKMSPNKPLNRVEALKEEAKSQIQNEQKQRNGESDLKEKLLALERELSVESIQSKTIGIFLPSELKKKSSVGTVKEIAELNIRPQRKGISPRMTIIFIIAAATGSAFEYLPFHLKESTWFGVFFVLLFGFNSLYACLCTGWCWNLMEEIWPEYAAWSRVPYQDMAYRAAGSWMKYIVCFLIHVTALVLCCNYILAVSENMGVLLYPHLTLCYFIIIISVVLSIPVMLGSYRNMKLISAIDVIMSLLFMLFVTICFFYDESKHGSRDFSQSSTENVIMAFAGISYAFGMGMVVPNIVVEMEDRSKFTEACVTAFMIIMAMYTVLAILGYAAYGSKTTKHITSFILENKTLRKFGIFIDVLQGIQLATTFTIYFIPLALSLEEIFKSPDRFCPRRATIRLGTMIAIMITLLGIPRIIIHLDVIVATFLNILSFLFPPIFHALLLRKLKTSPSKRVHTVKELILVAEILLLGGIIALVAIYVSVTTVIHDPPDLLSCFLNMSLYRFD